MQQMLDFGNIILCEKQIQNVDKFLPKYMIDCLSQTGYEESCFPVDLLPSL